MATEEEARRIQEAAKASSAKARKLLDDEVAALMAVVTNIDKLKPEVTDEADYAKIRTAVEEATAKNQSVATLRQNLERLGKGAISLAKEMAKIASGLR